MADKARRNFSSLLLLLFCSWINVTVVQSIPLSQFYPFGSSSGDSKLPKNDDGSSGVIDISISFPYFDRNHDKLFVNTNGVISFLAPVSQFTPDPFPLGDNRRLLTPFWADVDTRKGGDVWYRETTDKNLLNRAAIDFKRASIKFKRFTPIWLFIATWQNVAFYGSNKTNNHKRNTFQAILITNGRHSFVVYNYARLDWLSGTESKEAPAQCGFNAGDGKKFYTIKGSRTKNVLTLTKTSNVKRPGVWMFQVDAAEIKSEGCNTKGKLTISPKQSLMLGGENIYIAGPCFNDQKDNIVCNFGDKKKVPGSYIDEVKAKCVAPLVSQTGRMQLKVSLDGGKTFPFQGFFHYVTVIRKTPLVQRSPQIDWVKGKIGIKWEAKNLGDRSRRVNIEMANYKMKSGEIQLDGFVSIATQNNNGTSTITLPTGGADDLSKASSDRSVSLVRVSRNTADTPSDESPNEWIWSDVFSVINSSIALDRCKYWQHNEPDPNIFKDDSTLLPCPQTLLQALVDRGSYITDEFCNEKNQDGCKKYNPKATRCFRTITPSSKGAGQQCCYNAGGNLVNSKPGAGHLNRAHIDSGIPYISHYYHDILPYHECCLLSKDCGKYFEKRPNDDGSNYEPPTAASGVGDPHMVTLDGVEYTFNGYGEYALLKVDPIGFDLQGRMEPLPTRDGQQIKATVYTAFAMKENGSDTIEIRLNGRGFLDVVVNGQLEDFDDEQTVDFKNVMIIKEGNNTKYSAIFRSGIAVITEGFTNLLQFTVMMPKHFKRNTSGLLGYWDDNKDQEFLLPSGLFLNSSSNSKTLHYEFGLKWATQAAESLFTYEQGKSHQAYSKPSFLPVFVDLNNLVFADPVLERKARSTCGGSMQCLFDVQATGDTSIGLVTKNSIKQLQEIINITETKGCVPLDSDFANGFYQRNDSEGSITYRYRCEPGFILNGSSIVSCFQGQWNGTAPNCLPKVEVVNCPSVKMKIPNGQARSRGRVPTSGSEVIFECVEGYEIVGTQSILCRQNGTWSSELPYCRKRCSKVTITNGNTTYNDTEHHVTAHFTCIEGYTLTAAPQILCVKSNGTWTAEPPDCKLASADAVEHYRDSKGHQTKAIAIGVTLSVIMLLMLCILVVYLLVKRKSMNKKPAQQTINMENEVTLLTKGDQNKPKVKMVYL